VPDAAIPRSLRNLGLPDDKEGNQLFVITVMSHFLDDFLAQCRKQSYTVKKFVYDYEKYKADLHQKTVLETSFEQKKVRYFC